MAHSVVNYMYLNKMNLKAMKAGAHVSNLI